MHRFLPNVSCHRQPPHPHRTVENDYTLSPVVDLPKFWHRPPHTHVQPCLEAISKSFTLFILNHQARRLLLGTYTHTHLEEQALGWVNFATPCSLLKACWGPKQMCLIWMNWDVIWVWKCVGKQYKTLCITVRKYVECDSGVGPWKPRTENDPNRVTSGGYSYEPYALSALVCRFECSTAFPVDPTQRRILASRVRFLRG